jgi:site-specific DNA-cytosine methylase
VNVLSLFNGMSFGYMALQSLGKPITNYYSSEIDKYANQATQVMFPDVIQLGDLTKWKDWGIDLGSIDLLLAGFPCQAWSTAGKQKGNDDPRGALVHDLVAIWEEIKKRNHNVKFMFENVKMKNEFLDYINNLFGVKPICINSSLVSAQNRERYYWTNIARIEQPEDRGIYFTSAHCAGRKPRIVTRTRNNKTNCITANYFKGLDADSRPGVCGVECLGLDYHSARKKGFRMLTPRECFELQTVPEKYIDILLSSGISNTQLYKMAGNGWTHDVITHILDAL